MASEMTPSLGRHAMIWAHMVIAKTLRAAHVGLQEEPMSPAHFHLPASFFRGDKPPSDELQASIIHVPATAATVFGPGNAWMLCRSETK